MRKKVYISGAIAHHVIEERKETFRKAADRLQKWGYEPVNPFDNGIPDEAYFTEHMKADMKMLLDCDFIYMLRGWEMSKGAKLEHDVATSCGLKVLEYE